MSPKRLKLITETSPRAGNLHHLQNPGVLRILEKKNPCRKPGIRSVANRRRGHTDHAAHPRRTSRRDVRGASCMAGTHPSRLRAPPALLGLGKAVHFRLGVDVARRFLFLPNLGGWCQEVHFRASELWTSWRKVAGTPQKKNQN